jgi:hypothetical protein
VGAKVARLRLAAAGVASTATPIVGANPVNERLAVVGVNLRSREGANVDRVRVAVAGVIPLLCETVGAKVERVRV